MSITSHERVQLLYDWWAKKSRVNFLAYRRFIRSNDFIYNWFVVDLCRNLQKFYVDYIKGLRPIIIINTPPQHGKSIALTDFISWVTGLIPSVRIIYASASENLGIRCNISLQRIYDDKKFKDIFDNFNISKRNSIQLSGAPKRNKKEIEFWNNQNKYGYFRNTTVQGQIVGETLDIGVIDDPVKSRAEANSPTISQKTWEWYNDDFRTRFDNLAGMILIQTRWAVNDLTGRIIDRNQNVNILTYKAIATDDEKHRKIGEPLFPKLKDISFLKERKKGMHKENWNSLYQCNPTIPGGNFFLDDWIKWWQVLPKLKYKFIVADTSHKEKDVNDFSVFQCWGYGIDDNIYILDKKRGKWPAPDLRIQAELFYRKHNTRRLKADDPILRGMYIEDKASGIGLIQELRRLRLNINEIPRHHDKLYRAQDVSHFMQAGRVFLNTKIDDMDNLTKEMREFPNSEFDDDIDTLMSAVEITMINYQAENLLEAAMMAN
jgi:predicted phage terminase large subunit-like protein